MFDASILVIDVITHHSSVTSLYKIKNSGRRIDTIGNFASLMIYYIHVGTTIITVTVATRR